ncbi:methyltransferase domain-containing protein [Kitasatospora cinereorecta]|uniref:Methyltransferase domain-containing protein n=1 Tax=Kitasatospora cinereorecta TaxID=285560 RepID=A0ABW0VN29_9ACTN
MAAECHPGTQVLAGSAEDIPLPDESVDAVVVGQAYHWFSHRPVLPGVLQATPQDALPQIHGGAEPPWPTGPGALRRRWLPTTACTWCPARVRP